MLLLLPNLLDDKAPSHHDFIPSSVDKAVASLDGLIAESEKAGRRFLKRFSFPPPKTFRDVPLHLLNEHTSSKELEELFVLVQKGGVWGVVSDCGLPCLADPGAKLVFLARQKGIEVRAFPGPSSIMLALMLSGFSGQAFAFHGYLPKEKEALKQKILSLQDRAKKEQSTQIFIEAPYRTLKLLETLVATLSDHTLLCLSWDLTMPTEGVISSTVKKWKSSSYPFLEDKPAVFLISTTVTV
jgi:16S rRNA (cytidine1402-2'-O)-methyltransferase